MPPPPATSATSQLVLTVMHSAPHREWPGEEIGRRISLAPGTHRVLLAVMEQQGLLASRLADTVDPDGRTLAHRLYRLTAPPP